MGLNCFMPLNPLDRIIHQQILLSVMSNCNKTVIWSINYRYSGLALSYKPV